MKSFKYRIIIILLLFVTIYNFAQGKNDTLKILFVGNSYTHVNNLPQITSLISDHVGTKLITRASTLGGAKLKEHWLGQRGLKTKEIIKKGNFDIVVLQGFSMSTIEFPDTLTKYAKLLCDLIKETGAKPFFYLTWAREKVPQFQKIINDVYNKIALENGATIVPVGKAWRLAQKLRPNIKLFRKDGSHPSELGTILTAAVFVATITKELPAKIPESYWIRDINQESVLLMYFSGTDLLDLVFCKKIVEETVFNSSQSNQ